MTTEPIRPPPDSGRPAQDLAFERSSDTPQVRIERIRAVLYQSALAMGVAVTGLLCGRLHEDWFGFIVLSCIGSPLLHVLAAALTARMRGAGVGAFAVFLAAATTRYLNVALLLLAVVLHR